MLAALAGTTQNSATKTPASEPERDPLVGVMLPERAPGTLPDGRTFPIPGLNGPGEVDPLDLRLQEGLLRGLEGPCMIVVYHVEPRPGEAANKLHLYRQTRNGFPQADFNSCLKMLQEDLQRETERLQKASGG